MLHRYALLIPALAGLAVSVLAQTGTPPRVADASAARTSWTFETYTPGPCSPTGARHGGCNPGDLVRIRVTTVANGLAQPWHMTFVPGTNDLLVTELPGRLRVVRNGVLEQEPVAGWPSPAIRSRGLN